MAVELATAYVSLVPSLQGVQGKLAEQFGGEGERAGRRFNLGLAAGFAGLAVIAGAAAAGIGKVFSTGFSEAKDAEVANAQLSAAIASTGNSANVSVAELNSLASAIQGYSGQTDDSIAATQALLLRFTSIKNVGPDRIFDDATRAAADMAARLGGDAASQAQKLGRALEDPIAGTQLLARSGVIFTQQQKDQVAAMVAAGDTLGAQRVILDRVNAAYGGSAAAFGGTFPGAVERVKRSFEDFSQIVIERLLPLFTPVLNGVASALTGLAPIADRVGAALASGVGSALETFGPILSQIGATVGPLAAKFLELWSSISPISIIFKAIQPFLPQLLAAFGSLASVVGGALMSAMESLMPAIHQVTGVFVQLISTGLSKLLPAIIGVVDVLGPVLGSVMASIVPLFDSLVPVIVSLANAITPLVGAALPLLPPLAQLVGAILPPLIALIVALLKPILDLISPLLDLLAPAIKFVIDVLAFLIKGVVEVITWFVALVTGSKEAGSQLDAVWTGVLDFFGWLWDSIAGFFSDGIDNAIGFVTGLPGMVLDALGNLGRVLFSAGKDLIQGLLDGASSLLRNIGKFFLDLLPGWIVEPFKAAMGIHSPSRVMRGLGREIPAGLTLGVEDGQGDVERAIYGLTSSSVAGVIQSNQSASLMGADVALAPAGAAQPHSLSLDDSTIDRLSLSIAAALARVLRVLFRKGEVA